MKCLFFYLGFWHYSYLDRLSDPLLNFQRNEWSHHPRSQALKWICCALGLVFCKEYRATSLH